MKRTIFITVLSVLVAATAAAQDCIFKIADDDTFEKAKEKFHDVMADLWHGPVQEGKIDPVTKQIGELKAGRDAVMSANLPGKYEVLCPVFSEKATVFSATVDELDRLCSLFVSGAVSAEEVKEGFSRMHDAYREMVQTLILPEDLIEAFHDVLQPLWHEAYPSKDIDAIKKGVPSLKVRAKLLVQIAGRVETEAFGEAARALLESVATLQEAIAAGDDLATLTALELLHDAYHSLSEVEIR